jgi:WD40 repeat protein
VAAEWYIEHNGKQHGPFTGAQLKELAASARLSRTARVRRGVDGKAVVAEKVKGLFPESDTNDRPVPPPLPPEEPPSTNRKPKLPVRRLLLVGTGAVGILIALSVAFGILRQSGGGVQRDGSSAETQAAEMRDGNRTTQVDEAEAFLASLQVGSPVEARNITKVETPAKVVADVGSVPYQLSPDGRLLVTQPGSVIWNVKTGKKIQWDGGRIVLGSLSPDGEYFAAVADLRGTAANQYVLAILSVTEDRLVLKQSAELGHHEFFDAIWSHDGSSVALYCRHYQWPHNWDGAVLHWQQGEPRLVRFRHPAHPVGGNPFRASKVALSTDGRFALLDFWEPEASLWVFETDTGKAVTKLDVSGSAVTFESFSPDGRFFATKVYGYKAERIILWDTNSWKKALELPTKDSFGGFLDDGKSFVTVDGDGTVRTIRSVKDGSELRRIPLPLERYAFATDGKSNDGRWGVYRVQNDGRLEVWQLFENRLTAVLGRSDRAQRGVSVVTPDGRYVACEVGSGVEIWDTASGSTIPFDTYAAEIKGNSSGSDSQRKGPVYFVLTPEERSKGWETPETAPVYSPPAKPITREVYDKLAVGTRRSVVKELLGGRSHKELSESGVQPNGHTWWWRNIEVYAGSMPGSIVVLIFERKARGAIGDEVLVRKMQRGLD